MSTTRIETLANMVEAAAARAEALGYDLIESTGGSLTAARERLAKVDAETAAAERIHDLARVEVAETHATPYPEMVTALERSRSEVARARLAQVAARVDFQRAHGKETAE